MDPPCRLYECAKPGVLLLELAPDDVPLVEEDGAPDDGELVLEARDEALRAQERRRLQTEELHGAQFNGHIGLRVEIRDKFTDNLHM